MNEDTKPLRIPVTGLVATHYGWERDEFGYSVVPVSPGMGKLLNFIYDNVEDLETDEILVLDGKSQENKMLNQHQEFIKGADDLRTLSERMFQIQGVINRTSVPPQELHSRDVIIFEFRPIDTITIGPDLWFSQEISRARSLGLIFRVNTKVPSEGVLKSMGMNLFSYAKLHNLI